MKKLTENLIDKALFAAKRVRQNAYAPYSQYKVGCAIVDSQTVIHVGCNVESSSYPNGVCAEKAAICNMISQLGEQPLLVVLFSKDGCSPCGTCLQLLSEFCKSRTPIYMVNADTKTIFKKILVELFPLPFRLDK